MPRHILIISGKKHSGKTSFLLGIIRRKKKKGYRFGGFVSKYFSTAGEYGYKAIDISSGREFPFLTTKGRPGWEKTGRYYFVRGSIEKISKCLNPGKNRKKIIVIDEIGPAEIIRRKGLWKCLKSVLLACRNPLIITVRKELVNKFISLPILCRSRT